MFLSYTSRFSMKSINSNLQNGPDIHQLLQISNRGKMEEKVTFHVLHDHAQMSAGLEGAEHADHKGILCKRQDVSLHKHLLDLVPQNQVLSVDLFHRETLPSFFMPYQIHRPAGEMENIAVGC